MVDEQKPAEQASPQVTENAPAPTPTENPLDVAKKILQEIKEERNQLSKIKEEMQEAASHYLVGGRSVAGQAPPKPKTQEDVDREDIKTLTSRAGF